jgi:glycosyltransferase involved in cell wall biosynthesis
MIEFPPPIFSSMQTGKKVLFISHDAVRCGAQILILNLVRWFAEHGGMPYELLLKSGGELTPEFARLGKVELFTGATPLGRLLYQLRGNRSRLLLNKYRRRGIGLVYSNTITNGNLLEYLAPLGCPVITHVHELENYTHWCGRDNLDKVVTYTSLFIAASQAVKENLVANHGILDEKVVIVHEYTPVDVAVSVAKKEMLARLSIPEHAFVVGGSGTTDWRKSPELFLQLARSVRDTSRCDDIYFVWIGGACTWELEYDMKKMGLNNVIFVPNNPTPLDYFNCFDVFALTSRIDPYPVVCLESAALGKPIICFDNAGGMPEFVEDDCGFVVPYLDLPAFTEKVVMLYEDRALCSQLGLAARMKVTSRHDLGIAGKIIAAIIRRLIK